MAGYNRRRGMSNNAVDAYRRNLKPISRFTAQDLRDADIHISLAFARWLAKKKYWAPAERHHSSKFYNKIRFYDPRRLSAASSSTWATRSKPCANATWTTSEPVATHAQDHQRVAVRGKYARWEVLGRYRRIIEWVPFKGIRDGNGWIHLPDGTRKKAGSKWVKYRKVRPNRNARQRRNDAKKRNTT